MNRLASSKLAAFVTFATAIVAARYIFKFTETEFYLTQLTMSAYYGLVVIGLSLLMGYTGQASMGHAAFFAIGGYTSAVLTTQNLLPFQTSSWFKALETVHGLTRGQDLYGSAIAYPSPWLALIAALLITTIIALIIGQPILKLKGHYLAMATLGFGTIIYRVLLGGSLFGSADGLSSIPPFPIGPLTICRSTLYRVENYYVAWGLLALGLFLLVNLIDSRIGRSLKAIHSNEEAASAMGIPVSRTKLLIFVISALYAAVAGVFMTHYSASIGPSEATVMKSVRYVALVAAGGMGSLWGTLSLSVILNFLSLRGVFGSYDDALFGVILIFIMLFAPEGLLSSKTRHSIAAHFRQLFRKGA